MDNTTSFNICVDSDILKQCEAMYGELGVDLNTAINVFLNKSLCVGGFPFDVNKETMAAMLEAERIVCDPFVKRYSDVEEALNCRSSALKRIADTLWQALSSHHSL